VLPEEQVRDTQAALGFLQNEAVTFPVLTSQLGVLGHSFGAAVAVYTAAVDARVSACVSSAGWGDGLTKLRKQHAGDEAWARFMKMVEQGRAERQAGRTTMVSRFDIVPIPPHLRSGLPAGAHMEFPFEVVESMMAFRPNDVVDQIAPRPLLLLHPAEDAVTPSEQSIELFKHANMPKDLHLFADIDHFIFSDDNAMVFELLKGWLAKHLPVHGQPMEPAQ
jgi:hypothetical protein